MDLVNSDGINLTILHVCKEDLVSSAVLSHCLFTFNQSTRNLNPKITVATTEWIQRCRCGRFKLTTENGLRERTEGRTESQSATESQAATQRRGEMKECLCAKAADSPLFFQLRTAAANSAYSGRAYSNKAACEITAEIFHPSSTCFPRPDRGPAAKVLSRSQLSQTRKTISVHVPALLGVKIKCK